MGCSYCDQYDTKVEIRSLNQFRRVAKKVRHALDEGVLRYNGFESDRELIGQESFTSLDLDGPLPDVMRYHFQCPHCGNCYGMFVETYHGQGGTWSRLGNLPFNTSLDTGAPRRSA
jgi:hypothetical protein